jgi:hypothetical protein
MFSIAERTALRAALITAARTDQRITGIALTGSGALGTEDRWSDIDLAFGFAAGTDLGAALRHWTAVMYADHGAVDHMDVISGGVTYRVFLLASTLQVDLAFAPAAEFGAVAETFRLLFGTAVPRPPSPSPTAAGLIGLAWLYALHARSSLARGRGWQAEYMISGVRDYVLALACLRHGLVAVQGRGLHLLPPDVTGPLADALVRSLDRDELGRAFGVVTRALITEIDHVDVALAQRLAGPLRELAEPEDPPPPAKTSLSPQVRRIDNYPRAGACWQVGPAGSRGWTHVGVGQ